MKIRTLALVLTVCSASLVAAHDSATGVVKERMEKMERFEELIERVFAMIHGEMTYDAGAVRRAAEEIQAGSGQHMIALFPEGSSGSPSEAKDDIWRDFETFENLAFSLERWSGELAAQADGRPRGTLPKKWEDAEMGPAMMKGGGMMRNSGPVFAAWHVAASCNACHAEFREED